jgi:phosphatidylinositol glycan class B
MTVKSIYILSAAIFLLAAFFSVGYYSWDEHHQILEFAGLKLGLTEAGHLPWEYPEQIRPTIQPALAFAVHSSLAAMGIRNPFTVATFLRILSAALSFLSVHMLYRAYSPGIKDLVLRRWFLLLSFLTWFALYTHVRFSSENWSGSILLIAFALCYAHQSPGKWFYVSIGAMLGLSFLFRYQIGFMVAGLWLWLMFIKKVRVVHLASVTLGMLLLFGVGVLIDRWFYGEWTLTAWNYFDHNILMGRAAGFGTTPWWEYLKLTFIKAVPPFSLVYLLGVLAVFVFRPKDALTWTVLPFLAVHFIIGHKELRFLFPVIGFLPLFVVKALSLFQDKWRPGWRERGISRVMIKSFWITNLALLVLVTLKPADHQISLYRAVYDRYDEPITLYFSKGNPYHRILDIHYYKRTGLEFKKYESHDEVQFNANGRCLFVTQDAGSMKDVVYPYTLVYRTFPEWVRRFNITGWVERTTLWYVYELRRAG